MVNIEWAKQQNPEAFSILDSDGEPYFINNCKIYNIMETKCYDTDPNCPWQMRRPKTHKAPTEKWLKARRDYSLLMSIEPHHRTDEVPSFRINLF